VKDCITVFKDGGASLYDDLDFRDVMDRLPSGIAVKCSVIPPLFMEHNYDDLITAGMSSMKKDKDWMSLTIVFKFQNRDAASDAMDDIKYDLENKSIGDFRNLNVIQDEEYIIATTEQNMETWFS